MWFLYAGFYCILNQNAELIHILQSETDMSLNSFQCKTICKHCRTCSISANV